MHPLLVKGLCYAQEEGAKNEIVNKENKVRSPIKPSLTHQVILF